MKFIAPLILIAFLGACRSTPEQPNFRPLPDTVAKQAKTVETVLNIPQKSLNADIVRAQTDEQMGWLINPGILKLVNLGINSSRKRTAKEALAPVLASLGKLDINELLRSALKSELKTVAFVGDGPVTVNASDDDDVLERLYLRSRQEGFLSVNYEYKLNPQFDALSVEVTAYLIPKSSALRKTQVSLYEDSTHIDDRKGDKVQFDNTLYAQSILFFYPVPERFNDLDANAAQWAKNDGELTRKALNEGATAVAKVIAKSLNTPQKLTPQNSSVFVAQEGYAFDIEGREYNVSQSKTGLVRGTTYVFPKSYLAQRAKQPGTPDAPVTPATNESNPSPAAAL